MAKAIRHLDFNPALTVGFEIISIDHHYVTGKKNLSVPHRASFYCILWLKEGSVVHQLDFTSLPISGGSFLFAGKGAVQFFDQVNPFRAEVLLFTDAFFCQHESDHAFLKNISLFNTFLQDGGAPFITANKPLEALWQQMQQECQNNKARFKPAILKNYLHNLLLIAERERPGETPEKKMDIQKLHVRMFINSLEIHFREQLPISFYAGEIAITNKVLNNAVQKILDKSPKQIITERILLEAKRLLVYSTGNIKLIGFELGFKEPTNFIKFFKNNTGITPAAFREQYPANRT